MDAEVEPSEANRVQRRSAEKKKGKNIAEPVDDPMDEKEEAGDYGSDEQSGEASEPGKLSKAEIVYNLLREQDFLGTRFPEDAAMEALGDPGRG